MLEKLEAFRTELFALSTKTCQLTTVLLEKHYRMEPMVIKLLDFKRIVVKSAKLEYRVQLLPQDFAVSRLVFPELLPSLPESAGIARQLSHPESPAICYYGLSGRVQSFLSHFHELLRGLVLTSHTQSESFLARKSLAYLTGHLMTVCCLPASCLVGAHNLLKEHHSSAILPLEDTSVF